MVQHYILGCLSTSLGECALQIALGGYGIAFIEMMNNSSMADQLNIL